MASLIQYTQPEYTYTSYTDSTNIPMYGKWCCPIKLAHILLNLVDYPAHNMLYLHDDEDKINSVKSKLVSKDRFDEIQIVPQRVHKMNLLKFELEQSVFTK